MKQIRRDTQEQNHPTGLLAGGAFAPYERFAAGKTSAQGEFISPEQFNHGRVEAAFGRRNSKRKARFSRAFLFGASGGNRTHGLLITSAS